MSGEVSYSQQQKAELTAVIDALQLPELNKQFLKSRWLDQLAWMEAAAVRASHSHHSLRMVMIVRHFHPGAAQSQPQPGQRNQCAADFLVVCVLDCLWARPDGGHLRRHAGVLQIRRPLATLPPHRRDAQE